MLMHEDKVPHSSSPSHWLDTAGLSVHVRTHILTCTHTNKHPTHLHPHPHPHTPTHRPALGLCWNLRKMSTILGRWPTWDCSLSLGFQHTQHTHTCLRQGRTSMISEHVKLTGYSALAWSTSLFLWWSFRVSLFFQYTCQRCPS